MLSEDTKQHYNKLIDRYPVDDLVKEILRNFINTYDGTNEDQLHKMFLGLTIILHKYGELKIVEDGYNQLEEVNEAVKEEIKNIGKEFENIEAGKFPPSPAVTSKSEEVEE